MWRSTAKRKTNRCGLVFFLQAEDGIRDIGVTGVQTCALPIFAGLAVGASTRPAEEARLASYALHAQTGHTAGNGSLMRTAPVALAFLDDRSEERRVGKAGRSRWSPDH